MQDTHIVMVIILIIFPGLIAVDPNFGSTTPGDVQFPEIMDNEVIPTDANKLLANTPQAFTENRGQLENDDVRFYAQGGGIWFTDDGVWFELREEITKNSRESSVESQEPDELFDPVSKFEPPEPMKYKRTILKQEFVAANQVRSHGRNPLDHYSNFFYGNNSSKWKIEVPNYHEIYYENLYNGIDLRYYQNENGLKYDFIVYPGANINQIKIGYRGADGLEIDQFGNIIIKTPIQNLIDYDLFIYQDYDDFRHYIEGNFKILNNLEYGFEISGDYNPQEVLIIDPKVRLEYSTFLGEYSIGYSITVDKDGNSIVTGSTGSLTFPTTPGAFNKTYTGNFDIFVTKFNHDASELIYSTYIGGNSIENAWDIIACCTNAK